MARANTTITNTATTKNSVNGKKAPPPVGPPTAPQNLQVATTTAAPTNTDRTFYATAVAAAQASKDTPKSAVLRTSLGFYTGSKRSGVKAGAEFIGRVVTVLAVKKA